MKLALSKAGRRYGLLIDSVDPRDKVLHAFHIQRPNILRRLWNKIVPKVSICASEPGEKVSLLNFLGPVKDQGPLGACTGFAYAGLREFLYRKFNAEEKDRVAQPSQFIVSPMFIYFKERELEGTIDDDNGAEMRSGCVVLNSIGVVPEKEHAYNPRNFKSPPTLAEIIHAQTYRAGSYHRLLPGPGEALTDVMKNCLRSGYAFCAGLTLFESFESDQVRDTGVVPMPRANESRVGGHAVLFFGFDEDKKCFLVRNSWGRDWGKNGNFEVPYEYVNLYTTDAWMIHLGAAWKPKTI